ncbi:MAG: TlpA disulfide reductase family protein [Chloroflexota bacterium]|nr:TlpA disulfide reductase family protein [Chloroflexota bacterium]
MPRSLAQFGRWIAALVCFGLAAALVILVGLPQRASYTGAILDGQWFAPEIGAFAPPFQALALDGQSISLNDYRGKPVVINFWATWCIPCEIEMPDLYALAGDGVTVLAVNLSEAPDDAAAWLAARNLSPTAQFLVPLDLTGTIATNYALRGQPTTFVLAPDGRIAHIFFGATTRAALEAAVAPFHP